ncbi:hypothetical protein VPJG_00074 [Vibrio phage jenny 12G5]|nr:hypothetical protein VPJG_00001 [Vibrio phage jenny 12G5]AGN51438.1 hypothetical protein VPJG_00074 [Vibrio phage jenny 12G5]
MAKAKAETVKKKTAIKPALTRKQVVAKQNLEQAVKECERVSLKVEVKFK